ncbi:sodium channel and clathrin linker 1 isoform X1 [Corythoichthys intestinalis]|uniref:sodium channel and clathrin linker 1 isoform X1 n=2 Tax=Corythoichthys intestinalis TaxID=161448 RepID=UPI0025A5A537|nr:sodium channel and clathrin linker 1-like isoform X1 [Corythoichthys intestinalis]XP_057699581.1 sodium channel and clathrin linker 1-like isoform X1 [Corythoichthys intestinalis]XP_057699582.1 sodium channel and clathrin linker 1-like isoform X1 [Corythoichthys intestinalis]
METDVEFLRDQVHRLNSSLSQYQRGELVHIKPSQGEEEKTEFAAPWLSDRSIMAPLIAEYDRHIDEMSKQLQKYQVSMADVKAKLETVVQENERLHTELRESVEKQLQSTTKTSGVECSTAEEEAVVKNLQEQIKLSEQERMQAMELWQTATLELDRLQEVHQKSLTDGHNATAKEQQLKDQLAVTQQHAHKLQVTNQELQVTNQQLLMTVTEQSTEMEGLRSQLRTTKGDLGTATNKVEDMNKQLQLIQHQLKIQEEDLIEAHSREDAAERRIQQLQSTISQNETRLKTTCQEADDVRGAQTMWEQMSGNYKARCTTLEQEKYEALDKVRESVQMAEEAVLQKNEALVKEKQMMEELEKTKKVIPQLIEDAALRTRKEVDNIRKQCNVELCRMVEELSLLQLECADKESQIERSKRERKLLEDELAKVVKESRAEQELGKLDVLHQRCLSAERKKDEISITLQSTQNKLKKMEMGYNEDLSRIQEEVMRLKNCLAVAREDCVKLSDERLQLQQENFQIRREMDELRKSTLLVEKKAKQQASQMEQEYSLKEKTLNAQMSDLEESSRNSSADLMRLLTAQKKSIQRWKDEAKNMSQAFANKMKNLKAELSQQKQRSHELELQLKSNFKVIEEYERQLAESQEKASRLQRRLTDVEQRAAIASQQMTIMTSKQRKIHFSDAKNE